MLTLFPESTAWDHKGMVQRNKRALAVVPVLAAESGVIRISCELCPISIYSLRESLHERIRDVPQERRIAVEPC